MASAFRSASAFKAALEARLRNRSKDSGLSLQTLQLRFVIERLLARLFHSTDALWLLKGGFALDLRYRPHARSTKDVDLSVPVSLGGARADIRDRLQSSADLDLGDYITFRIGERRSEITNAPGGGGRFLCEALILGKTYARFFVDIGFGDAITGAPERLAGDDFLSFAGIPPAIANSISKSQQFAEKVHAFTFPWTGRLNTRTKDLVDLVLLIERGAIDAEWLRTALVATFQARNSHAVPMTLPRPPVQWRTEFPVMADEAKLSATDLDSAFGMLEAYWATNSLGDV